MAAVAAITVVVSACGDDPTSDAEAAPSATEAAPSSDAADAGGSGAGIELLDFTAPLVGGGTFDGATYGERPVVLWFWAPT